MGASLEPSSPVDTSSTSTPSDVFVLTQETLFCVALAVMGTVGMVLFQIQLYSWRALGVGPVGRGTFAWALVSLAVGALLFAGASRGLVQLRRLILCLALVTAPLLQWLYANNLVHLKEMSVWGWLAMVFCGCCGGGEVSSFVASLRQKERQGIKLSLLAVVLVCLVAPTMLLPYFGPLPVQLLYGCLVAWWGLLAQAEGAYFGRTTGLLAGAGCGLAVGLFLHLTGQHVGQSRYTPVASTKTLLAKGPSPTLYLDTSSRVHQLVVRQQGWEYLSSDAHRWAEALVHPAQAVSPRGKDILLLGGATGMVLRELLDDPGVRSVEVWTPHPQRVAFFHKQPLLVREHHNSFSDPRVQVLRFPDKSLLYQTLQRNKKRFDRVFVALPRQWVESSVALTHKHLFRLLGQQLRRGGTMAILWGELQPVRGYACMLRALREEGWQTLPYRSLGTGIVWGLVIASRGRLPQAQALKLPRGLRYLKQQRWPALVQFPPTQSPTLTPTDHCQE